jgi:hypothetical protein
MASESAAGRGTGNGEIAVYQEKGGGVRLEVGLEGDTVWLSLAQMAALFGRDKSFISRHLRRIFETHVLTRRQPLQKVQRFDARGIVRSFVRSSTTPC